MSPWFENFREILGEISKEKQLIGPLEASHIKRAILRRIEKTNVKGSYVIDDLVEDVGLKNL